MTANVDAEEVEALLQPKAVSQTEVAERDFRRPRRLSPERLTAFEATFARSAIGFAERLGAHFGRTPLVSAASTREALAGELYDHLPEPFVAAEFRVADQVGWLSVDALFASRLVERMLGGSGDIADSRPLSRTETRLLSAFLNDALGALIVDLGATLGPVAIHQETTTLGAWTDVGTNADAHRVVAELDLALGNERFVLELWLPGALVPGARTAGAITAAVPRHLTAVDLTLTVELAGAEVSLAELLALEVGDVIPIDAKVGDAARITLDGRPLAYGRLGQRNGMLAARIDSFDGLPPRSEEIATEPTVPSRTGRSRPSDE